MFWLLPFLIGFAHADGPLSSGYSKSSEHFEQRNDKPSRRLPYEDAKFQFILESGTEYGHVQAGRYLVRIDDNKAVELTESFYGKFYKRQDDSGFKYIQSNDGSCVYKLKSEFFNSVELELALHEPPLKYTPAPTNIFHTDYDKKLIILPEVTILIGMVQGEYMKDLFNDNKAKDFDFWGEPIRFQTQFRASPFARATAETSQGNVAFKFNSADLLFSVEHPIENRLGAFILGLFFQNQWLNIKDQPEIVSIKASNHTNKSFGLSLAQVFE